MTQAQSTPTNQQHVWLQSGLWLRQSDKDQSGRAYATQREAIRAAQEELIRRGGGQITIDVPSAAGLAKSNEARTLNLPDIMSQTGAVQIKMVQGVPVFRAASVVQERIEDLLFKQREEGLTPEEKRELDQFEDVDHYFTRLNLLIQNMHSTD